MVNFGENQNTKSLMKNIALLLLVSVFVFSCKNDKKEEQTENTTETTQTEMEKNLSKYVNVKLTADLSKLTEKERQMIPILIEAADKMNDLFWYESYGDKTELLNSISDEDTKKYVTINYGPWDRLDGNKSFVRRDWR